MWDLIKKLWGYWRAFADAVLETVFQVLLLVFYFSILIPFALIFKFTDKETFAPGWFKSLESKAKDLY